MDWFTIDTIIVSSCPIAITILSIIFGIVLLNKHYYVIYLPWAMGIVFLLSCVIYFLLYIATDSFNYWILNVLCNQDVDVFYKFLLWGGASIIASFAFSFISSIYFIFFHKVKCIRYEERYMKLYIYVTALPTIVIMFFWHQYILGILNSWTIVGILFTALILLNSIIYIVIKEKIKVKSKVETCINFVINVILVIYITKIENYSGISWYISYHLAHLFCCILYEVKRSKHVDYPKNVDSVDENIFILRYIPLTVMVSCCLFIAFVQ